MTTATYIIYQFGHDLETNNLHDINLWHYYDLFSLLHL